MPQGTASSCYDLSPQVERGRWPGPFSIGWNGPWSLSSPVLSPRADMNCVESSSNLYHPSAEIDEPGIAQFAGPIEHSGPPFLCHPSGTLNPGGPRVQTPDKMTMVYICVGINGSLSLAFESPGFPPENARSLQPTGADAVTYLPDPSICKTDNTVFSGEGIVAFPLPGSETPGNDGTWVAWGLLCVQVAPVSRKDAGRGSVQGISKLEGALATKVASMMASMTRTHHGKRAVRREVLSLPTRMPSGVGKIAGGGPSPDRPEGLARFLVLLAHEAEGRGQTSKLSQQGRLS